MTANRYQPYSPALDAKHRAAVQKALSSGNGRRIQRADDGFDRRSPAGWSQSAEPADMQKKIPTGKIVVLGGIALSLGVIFGTLIMAARPAPPPSPEVK